MGGHGHEPPYKIPHFSKFNSIKGIPQLEDLEKALAAKNLKDPWIRNEVWRYDPGFGTRLGRASRFFFRGLSLGLALTVVTVVATKSLSKEEPHHEH